ncbi:cytochrome P450 [Sphaerosporella brunnea]|uniref:Cytochrome P450 n=1 Tax=Sphaerosporella brunnea TaxID=1250544 RepID=A0A5J5EH51_9PEZI|nr:cytochrome P450 [Sphaerosporella brunnea]
MRLESLDFLSPWLDLFPNQFPSPISVAVAIVFLISSWSFLSIARRGNAQTDLGSVPILGSRFYLRGCFDDSYVIVREGYQKFSKQGKVWAVRISTGELMYILPPCVLNEIKILPPSKASFMRVVNDSLKWSLHGDILSNIHIDVVRYSLNSNLAGMTSFLVREREAAFESALGHITKDWKVIKVWEMVFKIMHSISIAVTFGEDFRKDSSYSNHVLSYLHTTPLLTFLYFALPGPLRTPFWWLSPVGLKLRYHVRKVKSKLLPEIQRRASLIQDTAAGTTTNTQKERKPSDFVFIDALLRRRPLPLTPSEANRSADELMFMGFEQGPIALIIIQLIYQVLSEPDCIEPLRAEVDEALVEGNGWTDDALNRMSKLDSFIRETLRLRLPAPFTTTRRVLQPLQLSNGLKLRPGMLISSPSLGVNTDEEIYPDAERFDGYRFYDAATKTARPSAGTTTKDFLSFGAGNQVCPGRLLAVKVIKLVVGGLLHDFDLAFDNGRKERPRDVYSMWQIMPDRSASIVIRRRERAPAP